MFRIFFLFCFLPIYATADELDSKRVACENGAHVHAPQQFGTRGSAKDPVHFGQVTYDEGWEHCELDILQWSQRHLLERLQGHHINGVE